MEQTDSCKRGREKWGLFVRRWRAQSRNIYEGPINTDNSVEIDYGSRGWVGPSGKSRGKLKQL